MTEDLLRVLVIDRSDENDRWNEALTSRDNGERQLDVTFSSEVGGAIAGLRSEPFEAAIMAIGPSQEFRLEGVCRVLAEGPDVALIAIVEAANTYAGREAVRLGAEDCWVRGELTGLAMRLSLRCAIHRRCRTLDLRNRWLMEVAQQAGDIQTATSQLRLETVHALHLNTLQVSVPALFESMVSKYQEQLDHAFEARLYRDVPRDPISTEIKSMAAQLQSVSAGPRDVVDIHTTAVRRRLAAEPASRAAVYLEEARVLSLEFMGQLAALYRNAWLARGGLVREVERAGTGR